MPISEQSIERDIDHLVVQKLLAVVFRANAEITPRTRQQISFQPCFIGLQRGDDFGIGLGDETILQIFARCHR